MSDGTIIEFFNLNFLMLFLIITSLIHYMYFKVYKRFSFGLLIVLNYKKFLAFVFLFELVKQTIGGKLDPTLATYLLKFFNQ